MNKSGFALLLIIILVAIGVLSWYLLPQRNAGADSFDKAIVSKSSELYIFKSNLSCTVRYSTNSDDVGRNITVTGLDTNQPQAIFSGSTGITEHLDKVNEDSSSITLTLQSSLGSIDSILLNKKSGVFYIANVTNVGSVNKDGTTTDGSAEASKGNCD